MLSTGRIATLGAFALLAAMMVFAAFDRGRAGVPAASLMLESPSSNTRFIVRAAPARSALRTGDRVEIGDSLTLAAYEFHDLAAGSSLRLRRIAPQPGFVDDPVTAAPRSNFIAFAVLVQALFLSIAALIVARGRSSGSLSLAWMFALLTALFNPTTPAWPGPLILAYALATSGIAVAAFMCAADFATRFAAPPHARWASAVRRFAFVLGAAGIACNLAVAGHAFVYPTTPVAAQNVALALVVAQALCFIGALGIAYTKAPATDRQRVAWVGAALAIGVAGLIATIGIRAAGIPEPAGDIPLLLLVAMPAGCAYAILRYRLLDIAFVVNRATVFGITSLLVLAALAVVDYSLTKLLGSWLIDNGAYVQLGVALAIGIATRPLHARVDRFVDDLFFRRRHEAERMLRRFARDVAYIDQVEVVFERTIATVSRATGLGCRIFIVGADGTVRGVASDDADDVDRNDAALVRLRATREPVDLHDVETSFAGDFAFPMVARNRLLGALVCRNADSEVGSYAPDEIDAIGAAAHAAGLALDLLRIEELERELETLRGTRLLGRFGTA